MHTTMLVCLLFFMFEISAGITEFPCKFPCEWRNKTFDIYRHERLLYKWKFSSDGETSIVADSSVVLCHQITERFLIIRIPQGDDIDDYSCMTIFYDIGSPVKFQYVSENTGYFTSHTGEFTDLCVICSAIDVEGEGEHGITEAVESGTPATSPPVNSVPCKIPSTCTSPRPDIIPCDTSDIIPRGNCPDTTTESPDTTTEQTTTITEATTTKPTKRHCRKKHRHRK